MGWSPVLYIQVRLKLTERLCIAYQTVLKTTGLERQHLLNFCPLSDCQMGLYETCNRQKQFHQFVTESLEVISYKRNDATHIKAGFHSTRAIR